MRLALVATLLAIAPSASDAKCAFYTLEPKVLNSDTELASDGGLIVAAVPRQGGSFSDTDVAQQKAWRFTVKKAQVTPAIEMLAPGLAVYRVPAGATALELADDKGAVVGKARIATAPRAKLAAPKVKTIIHEGTSGGRRPWARVTVAIDGDVPATAIAIVIADAKGTPRSWGKIVKGEPLHGYARNRCEVISNDTLESKPGDKVIARWIDDAGRKSDPSAVIVVGGTVSNSSD